MTKTELRKMELATIERNTELGLRWANGAASKALKATDMVAEIATLDPSYQAAAESLRFEAVNLARAAQSSAKPLFKKPTAADVTNGANLAREYALRSIAKFRAIEALLLAVKGVEMTQDELYEALERPGKGAW